MSVGAFTLAGDVRHLIVNDELMTIFLFAEGLEVKREIARSITASRLARLTNEHPEIDTSISPT